MLVVVLTIICLFINLGSIIISHRAGKKDRALKNHAFIMTAGLVVAIDIVSICLILLNNIDTIYVLFTIYFMLHSWLYFSVCWFVELISANKEYRHYKNPCLYLVIIQNIIIVSSLFGNEIFQVSKRILMGSSWWVALDKAEEVDFSVMQLYYIMNLIMALAIIFQLYYRNKKAPDIYRSRYRVLIGIQIYYVIFECLMAVYNLPKWTVVLQMTVICVVGAYLGVFYAREKLTEWALNCFANDLSDGFILYDERENLIYVNDLLKRMLPQEVVASFGKRSSLIKWASETIEKNGNSLKKVEINGESIYFKIIETPLLVSGTFTGTSYKLHDTTDSILKMEAMSKANEELARAAQMKSDFLANMSHEIRTPMNAVIGIAEMALREDMSPEVREYIGQIKASGRNLLNIINDILDFSRIESGKMEIIPDEYEPMSDINDVANTLMTRLMDKNIELIVETDGSIPRRLYGDVMRIRQILINLANNAIKFTKEGQVRIIVKAAPIDADEIMLSFHVKDTGIGIKSEDIQKLFVSFQQVDSRRNRSIEGNGLGLAISKRLTESMNGHIGVESVYGVGSDFYFEFPQKVLDATPSLKVDDAENLTVCGYFTKSILSEAFKNEMSALHMEGILINDILQAETYAENSKVYVLLDEKDFTEEVSEYFDKHKEINCIVLSGYASKLKSHLPNIRILRRPFTTLALAAIFNNKDVVDINSGKVFEFDFVAPDAQVLIVDDNSINITVAEGLLHPLGMKMFSALSGQEAIDLVASNHFDIIFMDHMMPELDGIETTHLIRETLPNAKDTPIIALTANAIAGAREMFLSEGMDDFVSKPVELRDIVSKVKQWLPPEKIVKSAAVSVGEMDKADEDALTIPGIDTEAALKLIGSPSLYKKITAEYYNSINAKRADIENAFANADWPDYTIKVHALKSSSRQIGAMTLAGMAEALEKAGHEENTTYILENTAEMLQEYARVSELLEPYFGQSDEPSALKAYDDGEVRQLLESLKFACDELDMDAMEEISGALSAFEYPADMKDTVKNILEAAGMMDTETCVELIETL